ncbi:MAG: PAS domain-containing protein [Candidatus Kapabacteria bacterium]|nr:PAS domain-containing protein [Candidatus Kapabacteria bacterium]
MQFKEKELLLISKVCNLPSYIGFLISFFFSIFYLIISFTFEVADSYTFLYLLIPFILNSIFLNYRLSLIFNISLALITFVTFQTPASYAPNHVYITILIILLFIVIGYFISIIKPLLYKLLKENDQKSESIEQNLQIIQDLSNQILGLDDELGFQKKSLHNLMVSERNNRELVEKAGAAIVQYDLSGNIKYFNTQFCKIFKCDVFEASSLKIQDILVLEGDYNKFFDLINRNELQSEEYLYSLKNRINNFDTLHDSFKIEAHTKQGRTLYLDINCILLIENDQSLIFRAFLWDTTERRLNQKALIDSENRFRGIFENASIGLYRTNPAGDIILVNKAMLEILGFPSFEKLLNLNQNIHFLPSYDRTEFIKLIEEFGYIKGLESGWRTYHDDLIYLRETAWAIRDNDQKIIYYDGMLENITDSYLAALEREKLISELMKAHTEIKTLSGLLPTCASCKKIRDEDGEWHNMESYITERSQIEFSHGLCPDCIQKHYPNYAD